MEVNDHVGITMNTRKYSATTIKIFAIENLLHPFLLTGGIVTWFLFNGSPSAFILAILSTHILLRICENHHPSHPDWRQSKNDILIILVITIFGLVFTILVDYLYKSSLSTFISTTGINLSLNLWPNYWPSLIQIFLVYFLSEFVFYWIHRSMHSSGFFWKLSGHGFHHSFKNLHAINFSTSHPFEIFFLAIPSILLTFILGATPEVIIGGQIILSINASLAHSNIQTNSKWIGLIFTTSAQHSRHHSAVFKESNSNYSCNAIIFDRIFGTYSEGPIVDTGIGPLEPNLKEKLLLPFREPSYAETASNQN